MVSMEATLMCQEIQEVLTRTNDFRRANQRVAHPIPLHHKTPKWSDAERQKAQQAMRSDLSLTASALPEPKSPSKRVDLLLNVGMLGILAGVYPFIIHSLESNKDNRPAPSSTPVTEFSAFSPLTKQADSVPLFVSKKQHLQVTPLPTIKTKISYSRYSR